MPPVKTVYVPRFDSQHSSSQRNESQPDQSEPPSQSRKLKRADKRDNDRPEKTASVLKVKLPKFNCRTLVGKVTKKDKTPTRWKREPTANKTKTTINQGAETDSASAEGDVFFFSQRSNSKAVNEKEKAKLSVLRTSSKMMEENQLVRQRLAALLQAS